MLFSEASLPKTNALSELSADEWWKSAVVCQNLSAPHSKTPMVMVLGTFRESALDWAI